ncbi:MAG: hypothetical protein GIX03_10215 [Candidatus Eremiobacteraeota bacterium]|nr:hypothetical protein [Candidatus Eremiobacteraeota bacterium]MBC5803345.1 hypothetical protein [Candidatus Eremiobacteraeota bacterium]MBC5820697.1 hypothetical protein [Candidatus Eremiobacteraeota bacterium]
MIFEHGGETVEGATLWQKLRNPRTPIVVAQGVAMDWSMLWKDVTGGFLIAGFLTVFVPPHVWKNAVLDGRTGGCPAAGELRRRRPDRDPHVRVLDRKRSDGRDSLGNRLNVLAAIAVGWFIYLNREHPMDMGQHDHGTHAGHDATPVHEVGQLGASQ